MVRAPYPHAPSGGSAGRPPELPLTQQVQVRVIYALPTIRTGIDHDPEAGFRHAELDRQVRRGAHQPTCQGMIGSDHRANIPMMVLGDNQQVNRCLRCDVPERDHVVVVEHHISRYRARSDGAEEAVVSHGRTLPHPAPGASHVMSHFDLAPARHRVIDMERGARSACGEAMD